MAEENKTGSAPEVTKDTGSPKAGDVIVPAANPNLSGDLGELAKKEPQAKDEGTEPASDSDKKDETVPKSQYTELETKLGTQGKELGEGKAFIEEITPLLSKLEGREDLVKAIMEDKITPELFEAAIKGEVSTEEAKTTTKAQEDVKKDLGKDYAKTSPEEVSKLIADKIEVAVSKSEKKIDKRMSDVEQMRTLEDQVNAFIANTSDFAEYAPAVTQYMKDHPGLDDLEVAYDAVKGKTFTKAAADKAQEEEGEAAKEVAAAAAGGGVTKTKVIEDPDVIDSIIGGVSNPNVFKEKL